MNNKNKMKKIEKQNDNICNFSMDGRANEKKNENENRADIPEFFFLHRLYYTKKKNQKKTISLIKKYLYMKQ